MRYVPRTDLAPDVQQDLDRRQADVDRKRIEGELNVPREWKKARDTATLRAVLAALREMMGERERCMYCLDSHGTDIEHFWPKTPYPERMLRWANLLICCAECGRFKSEDRKSVV